MCQTHAWIYKRLMLLHMYVDTSRQTRWALFNFKDSFLVLGRQVLLRADTSILRARIVPLFVRGRNFGAGAVPAFAPGDWCQLSNSAQPKSLGR